MNKFCHSINAFKRRQSHEVKVGNVIIGGANPISVQSMTNTDTLDTERSVSQIERITNAGGDIIRLTAQGKREAENLKNIVAALRSRGCNVPLVADIHFTPDAAIVAAQYVEKVRINPGNFNDKGGQFTELISQCRRRGVALRIGVNHGSLSPQIVDKYGDTPNGMVASAMEFLELCRAENFDQVVISMKSSNLRVMVYAYRMLVAEMHKKNMTYPIHLGVTEAGNSSEGRVKSAVGIGALLADGIGDTLRVSLTEAPENEIIVAKTLVNYFVGRENHSRIPAIDTSQYSPYEYHRRISAKVGSLGGVNKALIYSEIEKAVLNNAFITDINNIYNAPSDRAIILTTNNHNGIIEQRSAILRLKELGMENPVILKRSYCESDTETLSIKAAADLGPLLLDGLGDAIWIENSDPSITNEQIDNLCLEILQAARVRSFKAEYIACPSCGRTLYNIEESLARIKSRTSHLIGLKIGVMGCIVNGPGEMADADYGYVGAGAGRITLYKRREVIRRDVAEESAVDELIELIKANGDWIEPPGKI